jgi:hypothetical protein
MKKTLDLIIKKKVNCSKDVVWWNYWDHEHLDVVHENYNQSDIMYDSNNFLFRIDKIKVPFFPFLSFNTPIFMVQHDEDTMLTYAIMWGITSLTKIKVKEIEKNTSEISMNYVWYLEGFKVILYPILKILIPIWNERVFKEDLPVKIRRQKITDLNFKDFKGMPSNLNDRKNGKYNFKLPIPRVVSSSRDRHPLSFKNLNNKD